MAGDEARPPLSAGRALARGAAITLFYYVLILLIWLTWRGGGLFIYEGF